MGATNFLPQKHTIEVSVFGGGIGESIVVHLGNNEWLIVDSLIGANKEPIALEYLQSIGVGPENVKCLVISHWDTDHIRGMSKIVQECKDADLYISEAMNDKDIFKLYELFGHVDSDGIGNFTSKFSSQTGTKELVEIIKIMLERNSEGYKSSIKSVKESYLIFRNEYVEVMALSPSQSTMHSMMMKALKVAPTSLKRNALSPLSNNHCSITLAIKYKEECIILGGDLEVSSISDSGWSGALASFQQLKYPKAKIFKVPHHGSETGYSKDVWEEMLCENAHAAVTAFSPSGLPSKEDISRLKTHTDNVYLTTASHFQKTKSSKPRNKALGSLGIKTKSLCRKTGQVRIIHSDEINVSLIDQAKKA